MAYTKIKVDYAHDRQVLQLVLDSPKGNVLDGAMMTELTQAIRNEGSLPGLKALVFSGTGKHFCFGASVAEHRKELAAEMLSTFHALFRALIENGTPTIAIVRGQCLGGGLELASFCNWIFSSEDAAYGQPEVQLAVFPPAASLILPFRIGQSAADDLILSGRSIKADEAHRLGLVHSVSADPDTAADEMITQQLLPKSAVALRYSVRASRREMHRTFLEEVKEIERFYVQELMATEDANEGITAFLEKRKAVWKDC